MAVTTIDSKSALIVVDLQKLIASYPTVDPLSDMVKKANTLSEAFRRKDLPVVLVVAAGGSPGRTEQGRSVGELPPGATDLIPELKTAPQDHRVIKRTRGAFTGTDLDQYLKSKGVTQVVVVGVATSAGVESTARHAYELGYHVTLASDAMTDVSSEAHAHSLSKIFPRLGETGTTEEIINLIDKG